MDEKEVLNVVSEIDGFRFVVYIYKTIMSIPFV